MTNKLKYPLYPFKDFRTKPKWTGNPLMDIDLNRCHKLADCFYECLMEGRKFAEKFMLEKDFILFIHATAKGGLAHSVDELYDDGFKADGVWYGFHFPFSPINEKIAGKIQNKKHKDEIIN